MKNKTQKIEILDHENNRIISKQDSKDSDVWWRAWIETKCRYVLAKGQSETKWVLMCKLESLLEMFNFLRLLNEIGIVSKLLEFS